MHIVVTSVQMLWHMDLLGLVEAVVLFTWTMLHALEMNPDWWIAGTTTQHMTAAIMKMLELPATQQVSYTCIANYYANDGMMGHFVFWTLKS